MTPGDNSMKRRPEIDGLPALAVIPVLLYHAQLGAPGGFVRLDVFFVISFYDTVTPFPGITALLPCAGVALFIHSYQLRLTTSGKLLSCRPFVIIGLISNFLYLWHSHVLVFANYWALTLLPIAGCKNKDHAGGALLSLGCSESFSRCLHFSIRIREK
jgi:peptidoglycan/LPS O-acetylase OafA/YrhL